MRATFGLAWVLLFSVCTNGAQATNARALLIAAQDYENIAPLSAPVGDAIDFSHALQARGLPADRITLIGAPETPPATRNGILDALERIERESQSDELVIIYYSGHGTQVRDRDGDETDQRDEAIVPVDAPARITTESVVTDDRIKKTLDRIRTKGAHVWAIFDSCLSGTVTRSNLATVRVKGVTASNMRGQEDLLREGSWVDAPELISADRGTLVSFFASRAFETSVEARLDDGSDEYRSPYTRELIDALRLHPDVTYRQLSEIVRVGVQAQKRQQTPNAEGNGLDRAVFGPTTQGLPSGSGWWPLESGRTVDVGWLGNVELGSLFTLHKTAALETSDVFAKVAKSGALRSILETCRIQDDGFCRRSRLLVDLEEYRYARLVDPALTEELSVAIDYTDEVLGGFVAELSALIDAIIWPHYGLNVREVGLKNGARITLKVDEHGVHFVDGFETPADELDGRFPYLEHTDALEPDLLAKRLKALWQIDRLLSFSESLKGFDGRDWISIEAEIASSELTKAEQDVLSGTAPMNSHLTVEEARAICHRSNPKTDYTAFANSSIATDCDYVNVRVASRATHPVRVYLMYYGPDRCLTELPLQARDGHDGSNVLAPAQTALTGRSEADAGGFFVLTRNLKKEPRPSLGRQGLIALALKLEDGRDPGYSLVKHCSADSFRNMQDAVSSLVADILSRPTLRNSVGRWEMSDISIDHLSWSVEPYGRARSASSLD